MAKFHISEAIAKPHHFIGWLRESVCISTFDFPKARQIR